MIVNTLIILVICVNFNYAYRTFEVDGLATVVAVENEYITLECNNNMAMRYCGLQHPNGTRFTFTGPEVNAGTCKIKIQVTKRDNGLWKCQLGMKTPGPEIVQPKYVRVADRLVALKQNVTAIHGKDVTLYCTTSNPMVSLRYCRFEPPVGNPFSINQDVTVHNPIMERYYYPDHKSLDRGDCAVTIMKAHYEDVGLWTCGADLEDDGIEYTDEIELQVEGINAMTAASATGIAFIVVLALILIIIVAIYVWRKCHNRQGEAEPNESIEIQDIGAPSTPQSRRLPVVVVESPSEPETSPL